MYVCVCDVFIACGVCRRFTYYNSIVIIIVVVVFINNYSGYM